MIKVNEYFDGAVKSMALENIEGTATIGVMEVGEYTFGTASIEHMTVTSGELLVLLPGKTEWQSFKKGEMFIVEKDVKFNVVAKEQVAYHCLYL